ncbi:hypothetical protein Ciccas_002968 [Cichlidogyrus casuarinus]|uniref:Uncharacterized protein n=1 Tax=Cichlidogyrus casuarinus TaxID=1844966 RepID=A0ABD2QFX0_9PLAT
MFPIPLPRNHRCASANSAVEFFRENGFLIGMSILCISSDMTEHSVFEMDDQNNMPNTNGTPKGIKTSPGSHTSPMQAGSVTVINSQQNPLAFSNGIVSAGSNALTLMHPTSGGLTLSSMPQVLSVQNAGGQQLIQTTGGGLVPMQAQPQQMDLIPVMDVNGNVFFAKSLMGGLVKNVNPEDQSQQQHQVLMAASLQTSQAGVTSGQSGEMATSSGQATASSTVVQAQQGQPLMEHAQAGAVGAINQQLLIHQLNPSDQAAIFNNGAPSQGSITLNPNVIGTAINPVLTNSGVPLAQTLQWIPLTNPDGSTTFVPTTVNPPMISSLSADAIHQDPSQQQHIMSNNLLLAQSPQLSIITSSDPNQLSQLNAHLGDLSGECLAYPFGVCAHLVTSRDSVHTSTQCPLPSTHTSWAVFFLSKLFFLSQIHLISDLELLVFRKDLL